MSREITLDQFLTPEQIGSAFAIWTMNVSPAREIRDKIIAPNIAEINRKLGQENDPLYLAYAVEHVLNQSGKKKT